MHIIRENINGKIFGVEREDRVADYKKSNEENDDVDLTIYEVVENATSKNLSLKKVT